MPSTARKFIADLMPRSPIYVALLTEAAKAAIGQPHPTGRAALRMLEDGGFPLRPLCRHFRWRTDGHRPHRRHPHNPRIAARKPSPRSATAAHQDAGRGGPAERLSRLLRLCEELRKGVYIDPEAAELLEHRGRRHGDDGQPVSLREINFDGIVGPSHNYAGLSFGNVASMNHAGQISQPRAAALQGLDKMRANLALGLSSGHLPAAPATQPRVARRARRTDIERAEKPLAAAAMSASAMWAANAATVSPAPDTGDGSAT